MKSIRFFLMLLLLSVALYNATKIEKSLTFTQNKDHSGKDPNTMVSTSVDAQAEQ